MYLLGPSGARPPQQRRKTWGGGAYRLLRSPLPAAASVLCHRDRDPRLGTATYAPSLDTEPEEHLVYKHRVGVEVQESSSTTGSRHGRGLPLCRWSQRGSRGPAERKGTSGQPSQPNRRTLAHHSPAVTNAAFSCHLRRIPPFLRHPRRTAPRNSHKRGISCHIRRNPPILLMSPRAPDMSAATWLTDWAPPRRPLRGPAARAVSTKPSAPKANCDEVLAPVVDEVTTQT